MPAPTVPRAEFARIWREEDGSASRVAARLGLQLRATYARRARLAAEGEDLPGEGAPGQGAGRAYTRRIDIPDADGVWFLPSDLHCLPLSMRDNDTLAMEGLLTAMRHLPARGVLFMGDALDGASIGRHPPIGWQARPTVAQEMEAVGFDLGRVAAAAGPQADLLWVLGNHDERADRRLAEQASEFSGLPGFSFAEWFPDWRIAWSALLNGDTLALHRWHGGVHARHNNLVKAGGCHVLSGDTHRLGVTPYVSQAGKVFFGVECGTMASPDAPTFEYTRGVSPNWQSGFAVLTIKDGVVQPPELATVDNGCCWFRGEVIAGRQRVRRKALSAAA